MDWADLQKLVDSKTVVSLVSAAVGALIGNFVAVYRGRVKILDYTVRHDPLGMAGEDVAFGSIRVTWQGHEVTNLFVSTLTIDNRSSSDYENLVVKVYTGETLLLTERSQIAGSPFCLTYSEEYQKLIRVSDGQQPSEAQFNIYRHQREYIVPVLNRGQQAVVRYLTTAPKPGEGPAVWADSLHPGVQLQFVPGAPEVHGVPLRLALPLGLLVCLLVVVGTSLLVARPWTVAVVCAVSGLFAQLLGAWAYRTVRFVKRLMLR